MLAGASLVLVAMLLVAGLFRASIEVPLRLLALAPALLLLLLGSVITVFSLSAFGWQRRARLRGKRAQGFLESVEEVRGGFRVRARWRNDQGREYHFTAASKARPAAAEGERVLVWVDEADPVRYHFVDLDHPG